MLSFEGTNIVEFDRVLKAMHEDGKPAPNVIVVSPENGRAIGRWFYGEMLERDVRGDILYLDKWGTKTLDLLMADAVCGDEIVTFVTSPPFPTKPVPVIRNGAPQTAAITLQTLSPLPK